MTASSGRHDSAAVSPSDSVALPAAAWLAALTGLPGMGPSRLRALLDRWEAADAWRLLARADPSLAAPALGGTAGITTELVGRWRAAAAVTDVPRLWQRHRTAGVAVVAPGLPGYPEPFALDPEPPAVLFHTGSTEVLERPRVAVVGTRRCTLAGRAVARELGRDLAAAGVCVVSGLALGIDGAAHEGALEAVPGGAAPVAVVGTGLDVVYPRRHAELWARVGRDGVLLSEYPLGAAPEPWRFPARNRLIAALADVVVVVESHARGGSMHTVEAALERDRPVMAVPGSVRSAASSGTNELLVAGCAPARDAADVLVVLGLDAAASRRRLHATAGGPDDEQLVTVLDAVGWAPATLEQVADRLDVPLGPVAVHLARLEDDGWLRRQGGWYERTGGPDGTPDAGSGRPPPSRPRAG